MGLETPTFISDLVPTNPISTDKKGQGDDHIRNLKLALQNTFPNATKPFYIPSTVAKSANYTVLSTDLNKTILANTSGGAITFTLPTLFVSDAGWEISFLKTTNDVNPYFIAPPAGTIQSGEVSGLAKTRRCVPGHRTWVLWTGTAWIAERVNKIPVGSCIEFHGTTLPIGFEWPNSQTLNTTNYPDYAAVRGSGSTSDRRGRVAIGKDDMGGTSANRIFTTLNGDIFEAVGGEEIHTLTVAEIPLHTHSGTTNGADRSLDHTHNFTAGFAVGSCAFSGGNPQCNNAGSATAGANSSLDHLHTFTTNTGNSVAGGAHNLLQPSIVENLILVVE